MQGWLLRAARLVPAGKGYVDVLIAISCAARPHLLHHNTLVMLCQQGVALALGCSKLRIQPLQQLLAVNS
jgi:hypothetical protein